MIVFSLQELVEKGEQVGSNDLADPASTQVLVAERRSPINHHRRWVINEAGIGKVAVNGRDQLHPIGVGDLVIVNLRTIVGARKGKINRRVRNQIILVKKQPGNVQGLCQQVVLKVKPVQTSAGLASRVTQTQLGRGCSTHRPSKRANSGQIQPSG